MSIALNKVKGVRCARITTIKDVIVTNNSEYKIIGYADLELRFNDDRFLNEKEKELEL